MNFEDQVRGKLARIEYHIEVGADRAEIVLGRFKSRVGSKLVFHMDSRFRFASATTLAQLLASLLHADNTQYLELYTHAPHFMRSRAENHEVFHKLMSEIVFARQPHRQFLVWPDARHPLGVDVDALLKHLDEMAEAGEEAFVSGKDPIFWKTLATLGDTDTAPGMRFKAFADARPTL